MTEAGLVLEGGATRGVFTSGALDYLMEKDLYFSYVVGSRLCLKADRQDKGLYDPQRKGIQLLLRT